MIVLFEFVEVWELPRSSRSFRKVKCGNSYELEFTVKFTNNGRFSILKKRRKGRLSLLKKNLARTSFRFSPVHKLSGRKLGEIPTLTRNCEFDFSFRIGQPDLPREQRPRGRDSSKLAFAFFMRPRWGPERRTSGDPSGKFKLFNPFVRTDSKSNSIRLQFRIFSTLTKENFCR